MKITHVERANRVEVPLKLVLPGEYFIFEGGGYLYLKGDAGRYFRLEGGRVFYVDTPNAITVVTLVTGEIKYWTLAKD